MIDISIFFSALVVMCVAVVLVLHPHYEDGLLGRLALAGLALAGLGRAGTILESGYEIDLSWVAALLWWSLTLFMVRHLYRFLRWRRCGGNEWRDGTRLTTTGKIKRK